MADTYYQTPTSFGVATDPGGVPAGATIITEAAYNALLAGWQSGQNTAAAAEKAANEARFLQAFKAYRAVGMTAADAQVIARTVGSEPAGFNPATEPFTPLHLVYQTASIDFTHAITSGTAVWEEVTELPDLDVPEPGLYLISWTARGIAVIPTANAGNVHNTGTTVGVYRNGVLLPNTETLMTLVSQAAAVTTEPALQMQGSGSGIQLVQLAAGDDLTLWAKRTNTTGTNSIISNSDGRCRISVERVRL